MARKFPVRKPGECSAGARDTRRGRDGRRQELFGRGEAGFQGKSKGERQEFLRRGKRNWGRKGGGK